MKPACLETYVTLCVYSNKHADLETRIFALTGLKASRTSKNSAGLPSWLKLPAGFTPPKYGWFFTSKNRVKARDVVAHLNWMLRQGKKRGWLKKISRAGYKTRLSCYWVSNGQGGGPMLPPDVTRKLSANEVDLEFDFYSQP
jgi:hypothetical protein